MTIDPAIALFGYLGTIAVSILIIAAYINKKY